MIMAGIAVWFVASVPVAVLAGKCIKYGGSTPSND